MATKIGVVGLGYVGLPVAAAFATSFPVLGVDINEARIAELQRGEDSTGEIAPELLQQLQMEFTSLGSGLSGCDFIIVAVPTPVDNAKIPNLNALKKATELVAKYLSRGTTVVYESTVYPGATEEVCIPILEQVSAMRAGTDFHVGYSPERINPGDHQRSFKKIVKVVSGLTQTALDEVAVTYGAVVEAGIYKASSIKVAEAAKVIENTQRDLNIALMNELAIIFHTLNVDTKEVIEAAATKWNFMPFQPGLVGGHCIGVDPYYLTYKAESVGYHPQVILAGRRINDQMGKYVASNIIKQIIASGANLISARVTVLGLTFKENVPDIRNTKVNDLIQELLEYKVQVQICDAYADPSIAREEYGIELVPFEQLEQATAVVIAVPHKPYTLLGWQGISQLLIQQHGVVFDLKGILKQEDKPESIRLWRL
ncbi:MAG: nucleotide sugar dehydrogenase [Candidatus Cohnella colombiensis]|uniref:Nucleotide sugar dehydrogenase n=1 Tax=Candidatus Cohnella colombiensis TaxID=3121368 RepID=A0AA95EX97_9BACL|nr:MAG: nucleotide sugar dehydrogenase [Cohnella sp.]